MDKQNVLYTYDGILFDLEEEENSDRCYNMDEPWIYYATWNKPVRKEQILYDSIYLTGLEQSDSWG